MAAMRRAMWVTSRASSVVSARPNSAVLAIAEPLLDDLIATDSIVPDDGRDIAPVGRVVQVDIAGRRTQTGDNLLLS